MKAGPLGSTEGVYATAHREALLPQLYRLAVRESIPVTRTCDCFAHTYGNAVDNPSGGHCYPTDMRDAEWAAVRDMIPKPVWAEGRGGRPEEYCHRDILDAIRYVVDNGVKWPALPADYPPHPQCEEADRGRVVHIVRAAQGAPHRTARRRARELVVPATVTVPRRCSGGPCGVDDRHLVDRGFQGASRLRAQGSVQLLEAFAAAHR